MLVVESAAGNEASLKAPSNKLRSVEGETEHTVVVNSLCFMRVLDEEPPSSVSPEPSD